MFILYFDGLHYEYYHSVVYNGWTSYDRFRVGEGFWLVPGTDPEDDAYGRYDDLPAHDESDGAEGDETFEYMVDLLDSGEVEPNEFRRQLLSVGYDDGVISEAIAQVAA